MCEFSHIAFACTETFQMAKDVPYDELLSFLRNLALGSQVVLPSLPDYEVKCELGRGLTSRVFCVNNERGDWVLKLPKPNHNHATRIVANEATIMNEMGTNQAVRENPHLAKFVAKVSVTFQGHTQPGGLLMKEPLPTFCNPTSMKIFEGILRAFRVEFPSQSTQKHTHPLLKKSKHLLLLKSLRPLHH